MEQWIRSVVTVCLGVSAAGAFFGEKNRALKLLCALVLLCSVVAPIPSFVEGLTGGEGGVNLQISYPEEALTDISGEELVEKEALGLLETRLFEEISKRFGREDFSLEAYSDGSLKLFCSSKSDFPSEEARLVLGVLIPGLKVEVIEN